MSFVRCWKDLPVIMRRAMVESVCSRTCDYLQSTTSLNLQFFKYWAKQVIDGSIVISNSPYLDRYCFKMEGSKVALCLIDDDSEVIDISRNIKEVKLFVYNVVNDVPFHSPIVEALRTGKKKFELVRDGVDSVEYGSLTDVKVGRVRKDSKRQQILRGELTRYEAYEKPKKMKK